MDVKGYWLGSLFSILDEKDYCAKDRMAKLVYGHGLRNILSRWEKEGLPIQGDGRCMTERFRVGIISSVHGIHGEVKVYPTTDDSKRFKQFKEVYFAFQHAGKSELLTKGSIEGVKFFKNMVIVKFKELHTPEEARKYLNAELYVERKDAIPLKKNENYIADLIGLDVVTKDGTLLGKATDVFPTGANHVLEVEYLAPNAESAKSLLIPYIKECILDVDLERGTIMVHLLDGLLDV